MPAHPRRVTRGHRKFREKQPCPPSEQFPKCGRKFYFPVPSRKHTLWAIWGTFSFRHSRVYAAARDILGRLSLRHSGVFPPAPAGGAGMVCMYKPYSLLHHFSFRPSFVPGVRSKLRSNVAPKSRSKLRSKLRSNVAPSAWNSAASEIHRSLPIFEPPTVPYRFSHHADNPRTATLQNHTARTTHPPSPDTAIRHSVTFNIPLCTSCTLGAPD